MRQMSRQIFLKPKFSPDELKKMLEWSKAEQIRILSEDGYASSQECEGNIELLERILEAIESQREGS